MRLLFTAIVCCFFSAASAQVNQNTLDSLHKKIDSLTARTDEKNYIRIPRADFDEIISNKINSEIHSEMHEWQWMIGVVLVVLGSLFVFYFKSQLKSEVGSAIAALKTEVSQGVDNMKTEVSALRTDINNDVDVQFKNKLSVFWDDLASSTIKRAEDHKYLGEDTKASLEKLLNGKIITIQDSTKVRVIDALIYYYFYSNAKDRTQEMIKLVKTYENELYLTTETYANLAIAFTGSYSLFGTSDDRTNSIEYCDKSINRLPDYGTPYALKLEVYMIYYMKGTDEEKVEALKLIQSTFHTIKNNGSTDLPIEIIERLLLDKSRNFDNRARYITTLESMFIPELNDIRTRIVANSMADYNNIITNENQRRAKMLTTVLDYGYQNSPILNGKWSVTDCLVAGQNMKSSQGDIIIFDHLGYTDVTSTITTKGLAYLIVPENGKIMSMNLYELENDVVRNSLELVYLLVDDTLTLCYSSKPNDRPAAFSSTAIDGYTLVTYKKTP